jgi:hypothetical protein
MLTKHKVAQGNTQGAVFHHLRASRALFLELKCSRREPSSPLVDLLAEQYCFLAICSNITLDSDSTGRSIPIDPHFFPLERLNYTSNIYGSMFGIAHRLYELIPTISLSAQHAASKPESSHSTSTLKRFEQKIVDWDFNRYLPLNAYTDQSDITGAHRHIAALIYQKALLIFLYISFHGRQPPTGALLDRIEPCLTEFCRLITSLPTDSPLMTTMMWPVIIAGSCMRDAAQRNQIRQLLDFPNSMSTVTRTLDLLNCIWEDQSHHSMIYGLCGIELTMKRGNINLCVG